MCLYWNRKEYFFVGKVEKKVFNSFMFYLRSYELIVQNAYQIDSALFIKSTTIPEI